MHLLFSFPQLFPACAGVILFQVVGILEAKAFPRVCGGDPGQNPMFEWVNVFSPRVRG